ncbi:MAG TPA: hypothetical protein ENK67_02390 [Flavobacteriia bacterium]|nr:hypothetical protein [Flavobacteriia bacterium]
MKTKELSEKNFHVFLNIEAPKNINTRNITSQEVQAALSNFFQQSPQILLWLFESLEKMQKKPENSQLPQMTKEQRENILASITKTKYPNEDADSEQWIRDIKAARMDKNNRPSLFDEN